MTMTQSKSLHTLLVLLSSVSRSVKETTLNYGPQTMGTAVDVAVRVSLGLGVRCNIQIGVDPHIYIE